MLTGPSSGFRSVDLALSPHAGRGTPCPPDHGAPLQIERLAVRRGAGGEQREVGLRQRRAGIAETVGDRIAAIAAEILERYLDAGRGLPALVFGEIDEARSEEH